MKSGLIARPTLPAPFLRLPLAHRGLHDRAQGRPENSRAAVSAAVAAGYGIEIDLQLSQDGIAMVFHDGTLDRLTAESGLLSARTASALGRIGLNDGDETIPTLTEILALVAGRAPLLIEIKDQTGTLSPTDGRLEAATVAALVGYGGPVALMSFNPHVVETLADLAPALPRGLTTAAFHPSEWVTLRPETCDRLRGIPDYDRAGASFLSHDATDLSRDRVAHLVADGAALLCWTIRSAAEETAARRLAQNITFEGYAPAIPA